MTCSGGTRSTLTQRTDIQRNNYATNSWGNTSEDNWEAHLTDVPCRVWYDTGRELIGDRSVRVEERTAIVPLGTDVHEGDRLVNVKNKLGTELMDGPIKIESVAERMDHMVLMLEVNT